MLWGKMCVANGHVDGPVTHQFLNCPEIHAFHHESTGERVAEIAQRITYLDTADSLAKEVHMFDGKSHGWDNGFWVAIRESSYP